ncbi:MAG: hypothetical protein EHM12_03815 [Dehalococcoidia bacterium]|nr:MAG: hypothetical protein EHM12_03815 [Dehalococcoidia bacterium]
MIEAQNKLVHKFGFWFAFVAFVASAGYDIVQLLQIAGILKPPLDAVLIYAFSLGIPIPFLLAMVALHYSVPHDKKIWTHAALLFTVIYTTYVVLNYTVQLATVIPASLAGTLDAIRILDQTPHSLFWDIDALGYIFLALATLFASFSFSNQGFERWVKWFFMANFIVTPLIGFVYFYPTFSYGLLLLATPWIITASGSMLVLALFFKRQIM